MIKIPATPLPLPLALFTGWGAGWYTVEERYGNLYDILLSQVIFATWTSQFMFRKYDITDLRKLPTDQWPPTAFPPIYLKGCDVVQGGRKRKEE